METRPFGKTGASFPILGFGGQRIVDEHGCTEAVAIEIVNTAIDGGVRYFDTAWVYSGGQAESRLGKVAKHRRSEMWIATKTLETTKDGARRQLEESLKRLQTDYVDEWRLHNIFDYPRLDAFTGKDGALEAAIQARHERLVRFISISGHTDPQILVEALNRYPFDSALVPVSALDRFKLSFAEEFLPIANEKKVAIIGMKALALGELNHDVQRALQYCFSLPLSMIVIGMESLAQLEQNLAIAESHVPMGEAEKQAFFEDIKSLVRPDVLPWKSNDEDNPTRWVQRGEVFAPTHRQEGILRTFLRRLMGFSK
ncbi:MAG: aldo/keto reductase [Desulfobacterales bacterium]|jgi:aryl-alcohol dehydrogenase-like predicted oxidoreductase